MTERFPAPCKTPGAFFTDSTKGGSRKIGNLVLKRYSMASLLAERNMT